VLFPCVLLCDQVKFKWRIVEARNAINDSAGSAGRTMAEDLENPEDKVRDNTISVRRSKQFMWSGERAVSIRYEKFMKFY